MEQNFKICIAGPSTQFLSGISYYTIRLANALSESSNVSVVCYRNLLPKLLFPGHARVGRDIASIGFSPDVEVFNGMDYNDPLTWGAAYQHLKKTKPDVLILQWWTSSVSHMHLLLKMMAVRLGIKLVVEFHEVLDPLEEAALPLRLYARIMGSILRRGAASYITHSKSDRMLVSHRYGIPLGSIRVVPHGLYDHYEAVDRDIARKKLCLDDDDFVVLSFGLVRRYKGIPYLIRAFELLPEGFAKNSRLLIVGEIWEEKEDLLRQVEASKYRDRITLIDRYVTDHEVSLYFSASDLVVLPYLRASQSGTAHIAMSFGIPVIASDIGGLSESLRRYAGTSFVPAGDAMAISRGIAEHLGEERRYPLPDLGWNKISDIYLKAIRKSSGD